MIEEMHGVGERGLKYDDASKLLWNLDSKRETRDRITGRKNSSCNLLDFDGIAKTKNRTL